MPKRWTCCRLLISRVRRLYKLPDGKPENTLELGGEVKGSEFVEEIVRTAHETWRNVVTASTSSTFLDLYVLFARGDRLCNKFSGRTSRSATRPGSSQAGTQTCRANWIQRRKGTSPRRECLPLVSALSQFNDLHLCLSSLKMVVYRHAASLGVCVE